MKKIKLFVFMMLGISCLFQSCKDGLDNVQPDLNSISEDMQKIENERVLKYSSNVIDENVKNDFEVVNGILHFRDFKSFSKVKQNIEQMSLREKLLFIEKLGTQNHNRLSYITQILDKINNTKSIEERDNLISVNTETIIKENDYVRSVFTDESLSALVTNEGMVYIGKILYVFTKNMQYIIYDGDKTHLLSIKNGRISQETPEIKAIKTGKMSIKNARLCNYMNKEAISTSNSNYRGTVYTIVDNPIYIFGGYSYNIYMHVYSKGSAWYGGANSYSYEIVAWHTLAINYTINVFQVGTNNLLYTSSIIDKRKTEHVGGIDFHESVWLNNQPASMVGSVYAAIEDSPAGSSGKNEYNNEYFGPGQWISPGCN